MARWNYYELGDGIFRRYQDTASSDVQIEGGYYKMKDGQYIPASSDEVTGVQEKQMKTNKFLEDVGRAVYGDKKTVGAKTATSKTDKFVPYTSEQLRDLGANELAQKIGRYQDFNRIGNSNYIFQGASLDDYSKMFEEQVGKATRAVDWAIRGTGARSNIGAGSSYNASESGAGQALTRNSALLNLVKQFSTDYKSVTPKITTTPTVAETVQAESSGLRSSLPSFFRTRNIGQERIKSITY